MTEEEVGLNSEILIEPHLQTIPQSLAHNYKPKMRKEMKKDS